MTSAQQHHQSTRPDLTALWARTDELLEEFASVQPEHPRYGELCAEHGQLLTERSRLLGTDRDDPADRFLPDVIEQMIGATPEYATDLLADLGRLQRTALYTAPEEMGERWDGVTAILTHHLGPVPTHAWQQDVVAIFCGRVAA